MRSLSSVSKSFRHSISELWGVLRNSGPVYYHLIFKGHIEKETEGEFFNLYSKLTLLGDLNNFIYPKDDSVDKENLQELLRTDEQLLVQYQTHTRNIQQKLKGITALPHLVMAPICLATIYWNHQDLIELCQMIVSDFKTKEFFTIDTIYSLSPLLTPLAYYYRTWIVKLPFRLIKWIMSLFGK